MQHYSLKSKRGPTSEVGKDVELGLSDMKKCGKGMRVMWNLLISHGIWDLAVPKLIPVPASILSTCVG
jgi:hypothetical protein